MVVLVADFRFSDQSLAFLIECDIFASQLGQEVVFDQGVQIDLFFVLASPWHGVITRGGVFLGTAGWRVDVDDLDDISVRLAPQVLGLERLRRGWRRSRRASRPRSRR